MNRLLLLILLLPVFSFAQTQLIPLKKGDLKITPILHASMVLEYKNTVVFIDPYGGADLYTAFGKPNLVLITDIHGDHMNAKTLKELDLSEAELVVPKAVSEKLSTWSNAKQTVLNNGEKIKTNNIQIEAIPMYNLPDIKNDRHPKGRGNGYVLTIDKKRIYISGDTEDIPEMRSLKNIDLAFVCMNLPYTMTIQQAADAVLEFTPATVYPFHYRGAEGKSDTSEFKRLVQEKNKNINVILLDWYPER